MRPALVLSERILEPRPVRGALVEAPRFEEVYDEHIEFVWRSLRRLGVAEAQLDDAIQDVFVVVHRKLGSFEGRASIRTWIFGIALRVARVHRTRQRRGAAGRAALDPDLLPAGPGADPHDRAAASEGERLVLELLSRLDDEKRAVFVMAELEEMSTYEIAEVTGVNRNTIASRLRAARQAFEEAVQRWRARERRGDP